MESFAPPRRRTLLSWTPALVVPALVVAGVIVAPMAAGAVSLPEKTPAEVIAMMEDSRDVAYTATVSKVANLGLPDIEMGASFMPSDSAPSDSAPSGAASNSPMPGSSGGSGDVGMAGAVLATALEFVSGEHTARVSLDPQVGVRVQVYDRLAERNIVVNETEAWLYDSSTNSATRLALPDGQALEAAYAERIATADESELQQYAELQLKLEEFAATAPAEFSTPAGIAQYVIDELDAQSTISMAENVRVADRAAYELRVTPDASDTLVESISVAIDAESGLPLRVVVNAVGQDAPAFSIAVSALDLGTPDPTLFTFSPPPGATVTEAPEWAAPGEKPATQTDADGSGIDVGADGTAQMPIVVQSGWATIVELPADSLPDEFAANPLLEQFATSVDGGSVVRTALATVFLANDGRIFVGTVPLSALQSAAIR